MLLFKSMESNMNNEVKVKKLISHISTSKFESIRNNDSINFDLGIDGDDAYELLDRYVEEFQVNCEELTFQRFFHEEGESFFSKWIMRLQNRPYFQTKVPIRVSHLILGLERMRLSDFDVIYND